MMMRWNVKQTKEVKWIKEIKQIEGVGFNKDDIKEE
jgi:hypothetical protein